MTLNVSIDADTEARLRQLARHAGADLPSFVADLLKRAAGSEPASTASTAENLDQALDELFQADNRKLPAAPHTYSREDIYADHE